MTPYLFATALNSSYYSLTKRGTVDLGSYWMVKNNEIHQPPPLHVYLELSSTVVCKVLRYGH